MRGLRGETVPQALIKELRDLVNMFSREILFLSLTHNSTCPPSVPGRPAKEYEETEREGESRSKTVSQTRNTRSWKRSVCTILVTDRGKIQLPFAWLVNPRRACAVRVRVSMCVCLSLCASHSAATIIFFTPLSLPPLPPSSLSHTKRCWR